MHNYEIAHQHVKYYAMERCDGESMAIYNVNQRGLFRNQKKRQNEKKRTYLFHLTAYIAQARF